MILGIDQMSKKSKDKFYHILCSDGKDRNPFYKTKEDAEIDSEEYSKRKEGCNASDQTIEPCPGGEHVVVKGCQRMATDYDNQELCMNLDKFGIFHCIRSKNHEKNSVDKYAKYHYSYLHGMKWIWVGHGDSKPERLHNK
jgi:hypothetical protein